MNAAEAIAQLEGESAIRKEVAKLLEATTEDQQAEGITSLCVLLGHHPEQVPQEFVNLIPKLLQYLGSSVPSIEQNATALVTAASLLEPCWEKIVATGIPKALVDKLPGSRSNTGLHLNLLASIAAVAQGGPPGLVAVEQAGGGSAGKHLFKIAEFLPPDYRESIRFFRVEPPMLPCS